MNKNRFFRFFLNFKLEKKRPLSSNFWSWIRIFWPILPFSAKKADFLEILRLKVLSASFLRNFVETEPRVKNGVGNKKSVYNDNFSDGWTDRQTELDLKDPTWVQKSLSEIRYHEDEKVSIVRTPPRLLSMILRWFLIF